MLLFSLISLFTTAAALGDGSPICDIASIGKMEGAHGAPAPSGFSLVLSSTDASGPITVTIANSEGRTDFEGILLFAQDAQNKAHLGEFASIPEGFKTQDKCEAEGFAGEATSTLTHADSNKKALSTEFKWAPAASDNVAVTYGAGTVVFRAVIATGMPGEPYQIIESAPLTVSAPEVKSRFKAENETVPAPATPADASPPFVNADVAPVDAGYTPKPCSTNSLKRRGNLHARYLKHIELKHGGDESLHKRHVHASRLRKRKIEEADASVGTAYEAVA